MITAAIAIGAMLCLLVPPAAFFGLVMDACGETECEGFDDVRAHDTLVKYAQFDGPPLAVYKIARVKANNDAERAEIDEAARALGLVTA